MNEPVEQECDIRIGTSGYDYPEWEGVLYPRGLGRSEYLGSYSESFSTLELRHPPRGMTSPEAMRDMMARTRRPLDFSVPASMALTHGASHAGWRAIAADFASGIEPLAEADRLCAVLLGFPSTFLYRNDERRYLDMLLKALSSFPLVVEFMNIEWYNARVIEGFKARGVGLCSVDLPRLDGLPPVSDMVTSGLAYVRMHGRNESAWRTRDAMACHEYRYSPSELSTWVHRIEAMSIAASRVRVFFTTYRHGGAPAAATELLRLASAAKLL